VDVAAVQAVIFDWGGTLTPWHTIDLLDSWLAAVGDPELADRLHRAEQVMWQRHLDENRSATMADIFAEAGIEHTDEMLAAFHAWWEPHTYTDPDAPELFAALRERGLKIGVLSNTVWSRADHERIFARDGLLPLIDGAVYTSEIDWTKPHPEAFRAVLSAVGVTDPARAVFVGDRLWDDISGAAAVGMRTILLPHSDIPDTQVGTITSEPDAVVQRLGEVLAVVDKWRSE
jgi:putative hydrolase of the HAD superfamily